MVEFPIRLVSELEKILAENCCYSHGKTAPELWCEVHIDLYHLVAGARPLFVQRVAATTQARMNVQLELQVQDEYNHLWSNHQQTLLGKYFRKENLSGKGLQATYFRTRQ